MCVLKRLSNASALKQFLISLSGRGSLQRRHELLGSVGYGELCSDEGAACRTHQARAAVYLSSIGEHDRNWTGRSVQVFLQVLDLNPNVCSDHVDDLLLSSWHWAAALNAQQCCRGNAALFGAVTQQLQVARTVWPLEGSSGKCIWLRTAKLDSAIRRPWILIIFCIFLH